MTAEGMNRLLKWFCQMRMDLANITQGLGSKKNEFSSNAIVQANQYVVLHIIFYSLMEFEAKVSPHVDSHFQGLHIKEIRFQANHNSWLCIPL